MISIIDETIAWLSGARLAHRFSRPELLAFLRSACRSKYDFFISYRHQDYPEYARNLANKLRAEKFTVFLDKDELSGNMTDAVLAARLKAAVKSSGCIIHLIGPAGFGGSLGWIDLESDASTAGRYTQTIDLVLGELDSHTAAMVDMRKQFSSVCIHEEDLLALQSSVPSRTTVINVALSLAMFRVWMRVVTWVWVLREDRRRTAYCRAVVHDRRCRRWFVEFLRHHGFSP